MMQNQRKITAGLISKMISELSEQLHNNLHLIHLSRENQQQESFEFRSLLQMGKKLLIKLNRGYLLNTTLMYTSVLLFIQNP